MVEDEYLTEGSITEFNGIHFDKENEYTYLEGKRLLKLLMKKIKSHNDLKSELGIDIDAKQKRLLGIETKGPCFTRHYANRCWHLQTGFGPPESESEIAWSQPSVGIQLAH